MYQNNSPRNESVNPIPSARVPMRPRFNTGEEYSMSQTSFNSNNNAGYSPVTENTLGYYESSIPGSNNMQRPLLGSPNNSGFSSTFSATPPRNGNPKSNMFGGGPEDFGIAPRKQTRRYKTGNSFSCHV